MNFLQVSSNNLNGIDAAGSITTNRNGGLFYTPLTGDMLSTVHDMPQVRLFINDVPTKCSSNCSFEWSSGSTPSVTAVSPSSGKLLFLVTYFIKLLSYRGFSAHL